MRLWLLPFLVLFSVVGCAARTPRGAPAAPPPAPPAPPVIAKFSIFIGIPESSPPTVLPLACIEGDQLLAGVPCARMVRPGDVLVAPGGRRVPVEARARRSCPGDNGRYSPALIVKGAPPTYAVWPAKLASRVTPVRAGSPWEPSGCKGWCSFQRTGHPRVKVSPEVRERLAAAVAAAAGDGPGPRLQVVQEVVTDLDGDGDAEHIYSLAVVDRNAEEYAFSFSGLFLERRGALTLLRRDDDSAVVLRGTVDLDGEAPRELWVLLSPTDGEGQAHLLLSLSTGHPEVIGLHDCRPER